MSRALAIILAALLVAPAAAGAHARLTGTDPQRGATVAEQPQRVVFRFNEPVEAKFGAVRVFDREGERVDDDRLSRPAGDESVGVGLRAGLADGTYTATYRLVSADGHPISGGLVFSVGKPGAGPAQSVDQLLGSSRAGPVTSVALGAAKAITYLATALVAGGLLFLLACAPPPGLEGRARALLAGGAAAGVAAGAAGIVLQGAVAGGTTAWQALDVVPDVLGTDIGRVWGIRVGVFALLTVAFVALGRRLLAPGRPAHAVGVVDEARGITPVIFLASCLVALPAFAGHPAVTDPRMLLTAADVAHVAAMSAWLGGLAFLLFALPTATRQLPAEERGPALARTLGRFSPIALAAVLTLAVTGTVQAIIHLRSFSDLLDTAFGRAVLIKIVLLLLLTGLGAINRQRLLPRLKGSTAPGAAGRMLRTVLRAEVALIVAVLGVTGALTGYPPPASLAAGPFSARQAHGPLTLELTVDPAQPGANELHVYLFASDGTPFAGVKDIDLSLRRGDIGPLPARLRRAGPGHFVADTLHIAPAGDWELTLTTRVSEFDEYRTKLKVPIE